MKQLLAAIEEALQQVAPASPQGLYDPARYGLSMGGKRMRPVLTLLAYSLFAIDYRRALPLAVGLETYHNHTLLHDDVMDQASMRRGKPSVWKQYGSNTAILSGDVMLLLALEQIQKIDGPRKDLIAGICLQTMRQICEGQQMDMEFEQRNNVTIAEYTEMITKKTAVLLACALQSGALLANAPIEEADKLYQSGIHLGLAFQLQDDLLDCYGNPSLFGKNIGGDILEAKKTFLLITALERASEPQRRDLLSLLSADMDADAKIKAVLKIYNALGVADACRKEIERQFYLALQSLDAVSSNSDARLKLRAYMESLLGRNA